MARGTPRYAALAAALACATLLARSLCDSSASAPDLPASPAFDGVVARAFREQASLLSRQEHCSADPDRLHTIGRAVGQQVRVYREDTDGKGAAFVALFTVSEGREEEPETILRMGEAGRN